MTANKRLLSDWLQGLQVHFLRLAVATQVPFSVIYHGEKLVSSFKTGTLSDLEFAEVVLELVQAYITTGDCESIRGSKLLLVNDPSMTYTLLGLQGTLKHVNIPSLSHEALHPFTVLGEFRYESSIQL